MHHKRMGFDKNAFLRPIFEGANIVGAHCFMPGRHPWVELGGVGIKLCPLVWGDLESATIADIFESQLGRRERPRHERLS